jgi:uncharacterized protein (TIGR01777 family)
VLSKEGGALPKMALPIRLGIGSPLGTGKQYVPFIHIDDLCEIIRKSIEDNEIQGIYNASAPDPVTNEEMTSIIAQILKRRIFMPRIPALALKLMLGEMSHLLLDNLHVSSEKIIKTGFQFKYATIRDALRASL